MRGFAIGVVLAAAAATARADPEVVLAGRVIGPDRRPAPQAVVVGTLEWDRAQTTFRVEDIDVDGSFQVTVEKMRGPLRAIRVHAEAPGYSRSLEVRGPRLGAFGYRAVELALRPAVDAVVQVRDRFDHTAIRGATVTLLGSAEHPDGGRPKRLDPEHGTFTFAAVDIAEPLELLVEAPGYLPVRTKARLDGSPQMIGLSRSAVVWGRLLDDATGTPVANCRLITQVGDVVTDGKGGFRVELPHGRTVVVPACTDYGFDHDTGGIALDVDDTAVGRPVTVTTRRNHYVSGTVYDSAGKPQPGVRVSRRFVRPPNQRVERRDPRAPMSEEEIATTDGNGDFVFYRSAMDRFELMVLDPRRWRQSFRQAEQAGRVEIRLPP